MLFFDSGQFFCLSSRERDVAAIDVNMGCPKEYSTKVSFLSFFHSQHLISGQYLSCNHLAISH